MGVPLPPKGLPASRRGPSVGSSAGKSDIAAKVAAAKRSRGSRTYAGDQVAEAAKGGASPQGKPEKTPGRPGQGSESGKPGANGGGGKPSPTLGDRAGAAASMARKAMASNMAGPLGSVASAAKTLGSSKERAKAKAAGKAAIQGGMKGGAHGAAMAAAKSAWDSESQERADKRQGDVETSGSGGDTPYGTWLVVSVFLIMLVGISFLPIVLVQAQMTPAVSAGSYQEAKAQGAKAKQDDAETASATPSATATASASAGASSTASASAGASGGASAKASAGAAAPSAGSSPGASASPSIDWSDNPLVPKDTCGIPNDLLNADADGDGIINRNDWDWHPDDEAVKEIRRADGKAPFCLRFAVPPDWAIKEQASASAKPASFISPDEKAYEVQPALLTSDNQVSISTVADRDESVDERALAESGLGKYGEQVRDVAKAENVSPLVLQALVGTGGPYQASSEDKIVDNARTVARALHKAQGKVSAKSWSLSAGTVSCSGDILVVAGDPCPSGVTSSSDGKVAAKGVREAWVTAMVGMEGLPAPSVNGASGAANAPAPPASLSGSQEEMLRSIATETFGLPKESVEALPDDNPNDSYTKVKITTDQPLRYLTTLSTVGEKVGVRYADGGGRSWATDTSWKSLEGYTGTDDPSLSKSVVVTLCKEGWGTQCSKDKNDKKLPREAADAVYTQALRWYLGTQDNQCKPSAGAALSTGSDGSTSASTNGSTTFTSSTGESLPLNGNALKYAQAIIAEGQKRGLPADQIAAALATVAVESRFRMYANPAVPESMSIPHDAVESDHDSVGLFQQRNSWGSAADRMDPTKSAGLFYDRLVPWVQKHPGASVGQMAQGVQVSAFPDRYAAWEQTVRQLIGNVGGTTCSTATGEGWAYPLSGFSPVTSDWETARMHPVLGYARPHWGVDIGAPMGTQIVAAADATVKEAQCDPGEGALCWVALDTADGWRIRYLHIITNSWTVKVGQKVTKGQPVAQVGSTGVGTGAHLHVETINLANLAKHGTGTMCAMDATWQDACQNPKEVFNQHGVNLDTGEVRQIGGAGGGSSKVVTWALTQVGGAYVWGGEGNPSGIGGYDCSGLVKAAFEKVGISLPHSAAAQCSMGTPVPNDQVKAGDLLCWGTPAYHIAIADGQGGFVGAQTEATGIQHGPLYGDYYVRRLGG